MKKDKSDGVYLICAGNAKTLSESFSSMSHQHTVWTYVHIQQFKKAFVLFEWHVTELSSLSSVFNHPSFPKVEWNPFMDHIVFGGIYKLLWSESLSLNIE